MNITPETIKLIQKQTLLAQSSFGMNGIQSIAEAIKRNGQLGSNFSGLHNITDIAKSISRQLNPITSAASILGAGMHQISVPKFPIHNHALNGLASALSEIAKSNKLVSEQLSGLAYSQHSLSRSLSDVAKSINLSHLNQFNSLNIAVQSISKSFLKDIARTQDWENIQVAEQANLTITAIADDFTSKTKLVTFNDLDNFRDSIVSDLTGLLSKTKTDKARQFISELIAVIALILAIYGTSLMVNDKSNKEVVFETKLELERVSKELSDKIDYEIKKLNKTRIALTNVNLRYSPKKNSKIIGIVKEGQQITVIEVLHKYLFITYIDKETSEPKSGFVIKKYFKLEE